MTRAGSFHVITVVWGRPYLEVFLEVAVPNQMTPGNLDALPAGSRYRVFTSAEDAETLRTSTMLGRIREVMPVDLEVMPELSRSGVNPFDRMTAAQGRALGHARDAEAALIFLNADHFMSERALAAVVRRHAGGSRAVACTGVRLNRGTFMAQLQTRGIHGLSPRALVALALEHVHPFTRAHMVESARTASWPISLYWNVPGEGILARSFYLHPLMVDPVHDVPPKSGFTLDAKYLTGACPVRAEIHVVTDSDELCLFELSPVDAAVIHTRAGGMSPWRAATQLSRCDPHQRYYWTLAIRIHRGEIGAAWHTVEKESARFARQVTVLDVAARARLLTARRFKRLRRRAGAFIKWSRAVMRPFSPGRLRRASVRGARRRQRFQDRTVRAGRLLFRRARRSVVLLTHSAARAVKRRRKRIAYLRRRLAGGARESVMLLTHAAARRVKKL